MPQRLNYNTAAPEGVQALRALTKYLAENVDPRLRALVELRVSQLNGCAYCLNLHTQEARAAGESQQRLDVLSAWRETSFFSDAERAALAWAEELTKLEEHGVPASSFEAVRAHFDGKALVDLTLVVTTMNAWNRISIGFGSQPPKRAESQG